MNKLYKKHVIRFIKSWDQGIFESCSLHFNTGQSLISLMFLIQQTEIQVLENEVYFCEFSDMKFSSEYPLIS